MDHCELSQSSNDLATVGFGSASLMIRPTIDADMSMGLSPLEHQDIGHSSAMAGSHQYLCATPSLLTSALPRTQQAIPSPPPSCIVSNDKVSDLASACFEE